MARNSHRGRRVLRLRYLSGANRGPRGAEHLLDCDVADATVVTKAADRLVAGTTGKLTLGFDDGGKRIERGPERRAGGAENTDGGSTERGRHMHEPGVVGDGDMGGRQSQNGGT